ncbi:transcription initiation factor TFIID subunit 6-like [Oppia nitens]|uniref:transcription initiation factor TFIID subunit 6-like n=1 Tax=Oppia nitens TaxID=1686743 RepID=UPI0023DC475B|nr:transcription initiation factor TFIID subunit 6-like [Oppia nitens]
MSAKEKSAPQTVGHFGVDTIKLIGDQLGISNITDDASRLLAEDVSYRVKCILQDSLKFAMHSKRHCVNTSDIDFALKNKNIEPLLGFTNSEHPPFRFASGGGRELFFNEEKEIDLAEVLTSPMQPKLPQDVALKVHWLSIDGIQPSIPENPPPLSRDQQRTESVDPALALKKSSQIKPNQQQKLQQKKKKQMEMVRVKQFATHELSVEQQLYYKEITEACVGSDEGRRSEALQSLTYDPGLHQMLPRLCTFISEGVKVNVVQNNLALLIYLMRMVKALLDNHNLYLEKYLHELIPTVLTCIVSKQLCMRPDVDNHWALRDFASRLLSQICKNFNTSTNNVQTRVTQLLSQSLDRERLPMATSYGAVSGLCELGPEVQRTFLLKRLKSIGEKIRVYFETPNTPSADKSAAEHIKQLLLRVLPNCLKTSRSGPDVLEEYRTEFGYLGPALHSAVVRSRTAGTPLTQQIGSQLGNTISYQLPLNSPRPTSIPSVTTNSVVGNRLQLQGQLTSAVRRPPAIGTSGNHQKIVVLQQPTTPGANTPTHTGSPGFVRFGTPTGPGSPAVQRYVMIGNNSMIQSPNQSSQP